MTTQIESQVNEAARRYARRVWWANEEDLKQEGWVAALEAAASWKPTGGASLKWYVWTAIVRSMRNLLLRDSAPVKAGWHNLHKLKGLQRAEVPTDNALRFDKGQRPNKMLRFFQVEETPESKLGDVELAARVRQALDQSIATGKLPGKVTAALIDGTRVRKLTRSERARRQLLRACKSAKDSVREDRAAQDLWESR
jgi:DNA-directed RNA polymerase specialized sigma24 family protein